MRRPSWRYLALPALAAAAACSDGTSVGSLSEEQARDLAGAVMMATLAVAQSAPQEPPATVNGPAAASVQYEFEAEWVAPCPLGGSVSVEASIYAEGDDEAEKGYFEYSMTQVHESCVVASPNDVLFTLDGAPDVTVQLVLESDGEGYVTFVGDVLGAVAFDSDEGSGTCPITLAFELALDSVEETIGVQANGTICGTSFSESLTVT